MLTQERANFFSGEKFHSLLRQKKTTPIDIKKGSESTIKKLPI
ncbi:hypothetical protein PORCAN_888 [Porphyromonas crevioricanis JCM 13913]|nr:hypothetical protein PORCAN_888 [Porphyromonas crevioricanis JCM 13913]